MATTYDMKSIADTIRKAQYGKDVREAIAQGMEAYDETSGKLFDRMQNLEKQNSKLQERCQKLEQEKATHDDLQAVKDNLQDRINHLYAGDPQTIKAVVTEILEEKGVI